MNTTITKSDEHLLTEFKLLQNIKQQKHQHAFNYFPKF